MKMILAVACISALLSCISGTRVIGGENASALDYPYQVRIKVNGSPVRTCAGSLISTSYVLSAASCFEKATAKNLVLYLGMDDTENMEGVAIAYVQTLAMHPGYNPSVEKHEYKHDIALLELKKQVILTKKIQLVALPTLADEFSNFTGSSAMILGWGVTGPGTPTTTLQQANVLVISNNNCIAFFGDAITATNICTDSKEIEQSLPAQRDQFGVRSHVGICTGDGGAPLVINRKQIGIASYIHDTCVKQIPSVFTRVSRYLDWIEANSDAKIVL